MARTTPELVRGIAPGILAGVVLTGYIDTASSMVTRNCAGQLDVTGEVYSDETLELIERWYAAHCTACDPNANPLVNAEGIGDGQEQYQMPTVSDLSSTPFGQQAMMLDSGGYLSAMHNTIRKITKILPAAYVPQVGYAGRRSKLRRRYGFGPFGGCGC